MSPKTKSRKRHIFLILLLIVTATFFLYKEFGKEDIQREISELFKPAKKPDSLAKVAIVIDDLGSSRKIAQEVLNIKAPLTLSIIPHEIYTEWIAEEGHKLGHNIIGHIPMEAKEPYKLGKGGLFTWMTDREIIDTLKEGIDSIPYIRGVSNHMGSAFTEDERAMNVLLSSLKKHRLFFLDSLTTPQSIAIKIAKAEGIKILQRDIFLDRKDTPEHMKSQWEKLLRVAKERGYAIAQVHPQENTIEFLKNVVSNNEVKLVPVSELYPER